jgi:hypothetical protein
MARTRGRGRTRGRTRGTRRRSPFHGRAWHPKTKRALALVLGGLGTAAAVAAYKHNTKSKKLQAALAHRLTMDPHPPQKLSKNDIKELALDKLFQPVDASYKRIGRSYEI